MLKDCDWSQDRDYKTGSENEPLQFYLDGLANSNEFSLLLDYSSSLSLNFKGSNCSACLSAIVEPTPILKAIRLSDDDAFVFFSFSFGKYRNSNQIMAMIKELNTLYINYH